MGHVRNTIALLAAAAALLAATGLGARDGAQDRAQDGDTVYRAHLLHDRE